MKRFFFSLVLVAWLAACSGGQPIPDWTMASFNRLEDFKKTFLAGNQRIADLHFQRALEEIKKSGDLDVLAKAYLIRMALEAAVLEKPREEEFLKIDSAQPSDVHRNFYILLTGPISRVQVQLLPEAYRPITKALQEGDATALNASVARIDDPVSRLLAAAVCIRQGQANEAILQNAIDTASRNGWKKPLLVYLGKLHAFYQERGQNERAGYLQKRIELIR